MAYHGIHVTLTSLFDGMSGEFDGVMQYCSVLRRVGDVVYR